MELMVIPRQVELSSASWHSNQGELLWGRGGGGCVYAVYSALASRSWMQALFMCASVCACACITGLMDAGVRV